MINIKGKYVIYQDNHIIREGENLITQLGEGFFLNRCINDETNPMQYIVVGNGDTVPLKTDDRLGNELVRKTASSTANLNEISVDLIASFSASEIMGVSEIGVANDKILISHDVFNEIDSDALLYPVGEVKVVYSFQFSTATIRQGWVEIEDTNMYRVYEPSTIIMVYENTTKNGYVKVDSEEVCNSKSSSYYYNKDIQVLYVHTSNGNHPDTLDLVIHSR